MKSYSKCVGGWVCVCVWWVCVGGWVCVCVWWGWVGGCVCVRGGCVCVCVGEGVIYKFAGALFLMAINFCK